METQWQADNRLRRTQQQTVGSQSRLDGCPCRQEMLMDGCPCHQEPLMEAVVHKQREHLLEEQPMERTLCVILRGTEAVLEEVLD